MNVVLRHRQADNAFTVAHSITAYDRRTDELVSETPIPRFLDTLAIKIAEIGEDDPEAVLSYELSARQVSTFTFLLGLQRPHSPVSFFLEPSGEDRAKYPPKKADAIVVFDRLALQSIRTRREQRRITESELTLPTLRILEDSNGVWVRTTTLITELTNIFRPTGADASILEGRSDTFFPRRFET